MYWNHSRNIYEAMSRISPPAILVKAAGNLYPIQTTLSPIVSESSKNFDSIIVGSLSPHGVVSEFSQEGEEVHILALLMITSLLWIITETITSLAAPAVRPPSDRRFSWF